MADVKKTIQINPEIFNIGSRKNKTEKIFNRTSERV